MRLRTTYKGFTEAVDLYFDHLMLRVVPLQVKGQTGPALRAPHRCRSPVRLSARLKALPEAATLLRGGLPGAALPGPGSSEGRRSAGWRRAGRRVLGTARLSVPSRSAGPSSAGETPLGQPLACEEGAFSL